MKNNIAIGDRALINATSCEGCLAIGKNAGFDITNQKDYIRIGNFTEDEVKRGKVDDCYIAQHGRVIIKEDVINFLTQKYEERRTKSVGNNKNRYERVYKR